MTGGDGDVGANGSVAVGDGLSEMLRDPVAAAHAARQVLVADPKSRAALQLLGHAMRLLGEDDAAERAEVEALRLSLDEPLIRSATAKLQANRPGEAERVLRAYVERYPSDPAALRLLADVAARAGRPHDAEQLLRRALELVPAFGSARKELAILLYKQNRVEDALRAIDARLAMTPKSADLLYLKCTLLGQSGRTGEAIATSREVLAQNDGSATVWLAHGRFLAAVGQRGEAVAAMRAATGIDPAFGAAWWALADLDVRALDDDDVAVMQHVLDQEEGTELQRVPIRFALARLFEVRGEGERSFSLYCAGHALRRRRAPYDPDLLTHFVAVSAARLTPDFFADRPFHGLQSPAPIFVLGMHRAGSTLVEQILASHGQVEGMAEMPQLGNIAHQLGFRERSSSTYLAALAEMPATASAALGEAYCSAIAAFRKTDRPFFVDKMPGNWRFIPLIQLILPEARIIDVRRDPFDCCVSNFCRYYATGQNQADDLRDMGRFYHDYVKFMDHVDAVLPGRVHHVAYEQLVANTEVEVRRLLDACGLAFDPACLRFFEAERSVRTPSAQQVRRPINRDGVGRWRLFSRWLAPLADGLRRPLPDTAA